MKRTVYVYDISYTRDGVERRLALPYLRRDGAAGACIHEVEADTGCLAKKIAKREHAEKCDNALTRR